VTPSGANARFGSILLSGKSHSRADGRVSSPQNTGPRARSMIVGSGHLKNIRGSSEVTTSRRSAAGQLASRV
jgi:hypothetical protein